MEVVCVDVGDAMCVERESMSMNVKQHNDMLMFVSILMLEGVEKITDKVLC